ncbi:GNAT family N-acetyltransferase [Hymenobacter sp. BT491]|nr:GNAT family N-acetyltransferase [Hymenobacter sp. BT491]
MTGKNFTPFPVLQTGRLTLRQLRSSDDQAILALRSNASVNQYLDRQPSKSLADAQKFIQTITEAVHRNESVYWAITLSGTDKLVGTVGLFNVGENPATAEIGYELLPDFQGKGLMQEALAKVLRFGFQQVGLHVIEAYTRAENQRSTRVLENLNFKRDSAADESLMLFKLTHTG